MDHHLLLGRARLSPHHLEILMRFGYTQRPEYRGREYQEHGTNRCEVHVLVFKTPEYTDWQPWNIVAYGAEYSDNYQAAARKVLLHFCEKHEKDTGRTPVKFFPVSDRFRPV